MHIVINRYAGAANRIEEALPKVRQEFVPLLKGCKGFLGYATLPTEEGDVVGCLIWKDGEAVTSNRDNIRGWVRANLRGFEEPTERFSGNVAVHAMVAPQGSGPEQSLYCLVRKSEGVPTDDSTRRNAEEMLAAAQRLPGFRGLYLARSDDDPTRGASVLFCDTKEQAHAVNDATTAIFRRNRPGITLRVAASGITSVLTMG